MNIRHCLSKFITITAVVVLAATSSCLGTVLSVPQYNQEQDQWCWDASSQMILAFYSHTYSQTEIANWAVGGRNVPNYLFNSPDTSKKGCDEVLSHFGSISSSGSASYISLTTLANEMANSRPVMIGVSWDSGGGHAIVLRGTDGNSVYVNDPWPDNGQSVQTYDGVRRYLGNGTWSQTLQMTTSHADNNYTLCVYYYNLYSQYYNYYLSTGNILALAYANFYYAYADYYYALYVYADTYLANSWYDEYMAYAYYYYYAYYGYYSTASYYYNYFTAYSYYYYAYYCYYYYMNHGDSSSASAYYNYYMALAQYYYSRL